MALSLAGSIPILVSFVLLVVFRISAAKAMGVGLLLASLLSFTIWRMSVEWWSASVVYGALQAIEIILIVFGAILLMNYLERSGGISTIRWHFINLQEDQRIQLLIIGFGFITIIEGAAGFGTPGALAAPLLIGIGFPPLAAAVFSLWFNSPNPPFGVVGIPTLQGIGSVIKPILPVGVGEMEFLLNVSKWVGLITGLTYMFWGFLAVFLLVYWFGDEGERSIRGAFKKAKEVAPFAFVLGVVTGATNWAVAWFVGPELPAIISGFVALGVGGMMAHRDILVPSRSWSFPDRGSWSDLWRGGLSLEKISVERSSRKMSVLKGWTPYILVAGFLLITRLPGLGFADMLREASVGIQGIFGTGLSFSLRPLYLPGTMPFIPVAILTGFLHSMDREEMIGAWRKSLSQTLAPAATLLVAIAMTQVMIQSTNNPLGQLGMMEALSYALAFMAGRALPLVSPWIGTLGGFITGSNTSSNVLFSTLQYGAAERLGISRTVTVALQDVGGGIGNLVSVLNVAAIGGVVGMSGREGDIIRKTIVPMVIYALFAGLIGLLLIYIF